MVPFRNLIFFYVNSICWIDIDTAFEALINKFKEIPEDLHPIEICMHFVDIQKGLHEKFVDLSFNVHRAGNWDYKMFIKNYYEIMLNYKYTFSNTIGSYKYY